MTPEEEIRTLLTAFQDGYTRRDLSRLDAFMDLFTPDAELIGTNAVKPGVDEWHLGRQSSRELIEGDWRWWGDLRLDIPAASIRINAETGWVAAAATVTKTVGEKGYADYLEFIQKYLQESELPAEQKLHFILRGGANTVYELRRGETFTWALRLTAVVVRQAQGWKFAQVHFSFPTIYFPDVRILE